MTTINYRLPVKELKATVVYTITKTTVIPQNEVSYSCEVDKDILLEEIILPSEKTYKFDFNKVKRWVLDQNMTLTFDEDGKGILTGVDFEQAPVTAALIKAGVGLISKVPVAPSAIASGAGKVAALDGQLTDSQTVEEVFEVKIETLVSLEDPVVELNPPVFEDVKLDQVPKIFIVLNGGNSLPKGEEIIDTDPDHIYIKEGVVVTYEVIIENNGSVKSQRVLANNIFVPQLGESLSFDMKPKGAWWWKKSRSIGIHVSTGRLTKFAIKRENQAASILNASAEGIDSWRKEAKKQREEMLMGELKLEKSRLELDKAILTLQNEIDTLKKGK